MATALVVALVISGCGRKGDPLPPAPAEDQKQERPAG
ncbi:MAG: lipoprotein [Pseudomonadota bacterium]